MSKKEKEETVTGKRKQPKRGIRTVRVFISVGSLLESDVNLVEKRMNGLRLRSKERLRGVYPSTIVEYDLPITE